MSNKQLETKKFIQTYCELADLSNSMDKYCYIDKLNDDCLLKIFEYLPIIDRIRSEAVSKKWNNLIRKSWINLKYWIFGDEYKWGYVMDDFRMFNDHVFKNLLGRFGKYLVNIDFSTNYAEDVDNWLELEPKSVQYICQCCPRLQALHLGNLFLSKEFYFICDEKQASTDICACELRISEIIKILEEWKNISNLKKFGLNANHVNVNILSELISRMKSLESLFIDFNMYVEYERPNVLTWPFSTLKEIIFKTCIALDDESLVNIVKRVDNLSTLILEDTLSYDVLYQLSPHQHKTLKNLSISLSDIEDHLDPFSDLRVFESFINLERLSLTCNPLVTDVLLQKIAQNCRQLCFLDISDNKNVTDNGMQHVFSLPKLRDLRFKNIHGIEGKTFNKMTNLEVLKCSNCEYLEDEGLCAVIRQSKIKLLDIRNCKKITNQFLKVASEELNTRNEKEDLTLAIWDTKINVKEVEKISPQLHIVSAKHINKSSRRPFSCFPDRICL